MNPQNTRPPGTEEGPTGGPRLERVVIGVDLHEPSEEAARWVIRHFSPRASHDLIYVSEIPELPGPLRALAGNRERRRENALATAGRRLDEIAQTVPGSRVATHIREGTPPRELLRFAEETGADLVVVGREGPRRGLASLLGSTAERTLVNARLPVLLVKQVTEAPPRRLLVAVDDSDVARRVLSWAGALMRRFDATATVLNVVDSVLLFDELSDPPDMQTLRSLEEEATGAMQEWLERAIRKADLPGSGAEPKVVVGNPSYEINSEARRLGADLVLLGSKGGDVSRTTLTGRIINRVLRTAPSSVLVIPDVNRT